MGGIRTRGRCRRCFFPWSVHAGVIARDAPIRNSRSSRQRLRRSPRARARQTDPSPNTCRAPGSFISVREPKGTNTIRRWARAGETRMRQAEGLIQPLKRGLLVRAPDDGLDVVSDTSAARVVPPVVGPCWDRQRSTRRSCRSAGPRPGRVGRPLHRCPAEEDRKVARGRATNSDRGLENRQWAQSRVRDSKRRHRTPSDRRRTSI